MLSNFDRYHRYNKKKKVKKKNKNNFILVEKTKCEFSTIFIKYFNCKKVHEVSIWEKEILSKKKLTFFQN